MHRKTVLTFLIFFSTFFASQLFAEELKGRVVEVNGLDVTIKLDSDMQPRIKDKVDVKLTIPGGEMLSIGAWEVVKVYKNIVYARALDQTGVPQEGQEAVIYSNNPIGSRKKIKTHKLEGEIVDIADNEVTIKLYAENSAQVGDKIIFYAIETKERKQIPEEILVLIEKLKIDGPAEKSKAVKLVVKSPHRKNIDLLNAVKDELLKGYLSNYRNKLHIDNMSWLCNILGSSGDIKYKKTLGLVYKKTRHKKLKKYAYKNYRILR
jgi:hypothetical protein